MPVPANATDIAIGVMLERLGSIDRSRRSGEAGSAAGLGGAGLKRKDKRPTDSMPADSMPADSMPADSGQRRARRYCQWIDCRHHAPTSIAPSSMVVTDCRAGSFAPPSEAACAFHLLHDAHKQVFSLRILDYGDVRAPRSRTQLSRTHSFSMSFQPTRL
jgi:hypothetical protein